MKYHLRIAIATTALACVLSAFFYTLWGLVALATIPYPVVVASAAMIAVGIAIGEILRLHAPASNVWLVPNVASLLLSIPLALPYPFDPGMPICMVSTAVLCGRFYKTTTL